jgi:hypothetical protein
MKPRNELELVCHREILAWTLHGYKRSDHSPVSKFHRYRFTEDDQEYLNGSRTLRFHYGSLCVDINSLHPNSEWEYKNGCYRRKVSDPSLMISLPVIMANGLLYGKWRHLQCANFHCYTLTLYPTEGFDQHLMFGNHRNRMRMAGSVLARTKEWHCSEL